MWKGWTFYKRLSITQNWKKKYHRPRGEKEKCKDLVLDKDDQKVAADYVVKKVLAAWGDSSSDQKTLMNPTMHQ